MGRVDHRRVVRREGLDAAHKPGGQDYPENSAAQPKHGGLGQEVCNELRSARAKCPANCQLLPPRDPPREQQARHVCARDREQKRRCRKQHDDRRAHLATEHDIRESVYDSRRRNTGLEVGVLRDVLTCGGVRAQRVLECSLRFP